MFVQTVLLQTLLLLGLFFATTDAVILQCYIMSQHVLGLEYMESSLRVQLIQPSLKSSLRVQLSGYNSLLDLGEAEGIECLPLPLKSVNSKQPEQRWQNFVRWRLS